MAGRTSEPRTATVTTTNASTAVTAAAGTLAKSDVGRPVSGTGIPANATFAAVASSTAATLSANATATGARTVTIGSATTVTAAGSTYGFIGYSPETETEAESYSVAANNAATATPDRITNTTTAVSQRARS